MPIRRIQKKVDSSALQEYLSQNTTSPGLLSDALHMAHSFVSACIAKDESPAWVPLALQGLERANKKSVGRIYVAYINGSDLQNQFVGFAKIMGITLSVYEPKS